MRFIMKRLMSTAVILSLLVGQTTFIASGDDLETLKQKMKKELEIAASEQLKELASERAYMGKQRPLVDGDLQARSSLTSLKTHVFCDAEQTHIYGKAVATSYLPLMCDDEPFEYYTLELRAAQKICKVGRDGIFGGFLNWFKKEAKRAQYKEDHTIFDKRFSINGKIVNTSGSPYTDESISKKEKVVVDSYIYNKYRPGLPLPYNKNFTYRAKNFLVGLLRKIKK